jgi:hypothetical protein
MLGVNIEWCEMGGYGQGSMNVGYGLDVRDIDGGGMGVAFLQVHPHVLSLLLDSRSARCTLLEIASWAEGMRPPLVRPYRSLSLLALTSYFCPLACRCNLPSIAVEDIKK